MTVQEAIRSFDTDEYDDFFSGPPEYKAKLLRQHGCSDEVISAYLSPKQEESDEPEETHAGEGADELQEQSLVWTKRNAIAAILTLLVAVAALVVAIVSCQRM